MGRALLPGAVLALAFGTAFAGLVGGTVGGFLASAGALFLGVWRRSALWLWVSLFFLGLSLPGPPSEGLVQLVPLLQEVTGRVAGVPEPHRETVSFALAPLGIKARLLVYLRKGVAEGWLVPGDLVRLTGKGELPRPGAWAEYLARRGIAGIFWADEVEVLEQGGTGLLRWVAGARERLLSRLVRTLPPEGKELMAALLLGARGLLPEGRKAAFRTAGVAHLLALSGLHLGVLAASLWWLLGLLRLRPGARYLIILPLAWAYVLLGGARVSLVRAGIMFSVLGLFWLLWEQGLVLRRWYDPLQALSLAALVVILIWPWSPLDVGFQLSFSATFAILLLWPSWAGSPFRERLPRGLRFFGDTLAASAFAQVGALPIVGSVFGYVAPYGLLANLILIPWTGLILWAGLFLLIISPLPWAPAVGDFLHRLVVSPYLVAVERLAGLPGAALPVGENFGLWCLLAALGVLLLKTAQEEMHNETRLLRKI